MKEGLLRRRTSLCGWKGNISLKTQDNYMSFHLIQELNVNTFTVL